MRRALGVALLLIAVLVAMLMRPLAPRELASRPLPARSYDDALRVVDSLRATDTDAIAGDCGTRLLTHGGRTARVVVLLHGLTNCPAQFDSLGRAAFAQGANVLIPRLPRHGYADRMTEALASLDARELARFTDRVLDAADGLGDSVTVAGLSIGGVMAAWAAQERGDVDHVVVIAPMLGWARAPGEPRTAALTRTALLLPNTFVWWDDRAREHLGGPRHVYPRFATRGVGATMLLGGAVLDAAGRTRAACRSVDVVTVGGDIAADNGLTATLVRRWRAHGATVSTYEFPAALHLNHDVVDPEQEGGNPLVTYPVLSRAIAHRAPAPAGERRSRR